MGFLDTVMNVVTLGGHSRLNEAKRIYTLSYNQYQNTYNQATTIQETIKSTIVSLGNETTSAFNTVQKAYRILRTEQVNPSNYQQRFNTTTTSIGHAPKTAAILSEYSSALSVAKGAGAGSAAAIGSWSLVGLLGTASTGTSIATLSGVAATNATLAWFGGGALAAGGAGMAGGMAMIGGLVALPLIAIASFSSHSKAEEIESETKKIETFNEELLNKISELKDGLSTVESKFNQIQVAHNRLRAAHNKTYKLLFPRGILSRIFRIIRATFWGQYYLQEENDSLFILKNEIEIFSSNFKAPKKLP